MATGQVSLTSDLIRLKWLVDKLGQKASKSFWSRFTGRSSASIIYQETDMKCKDGHTVIFDYSGKATGAGIKGDGEACTIGETKRKFSDKITVNMFSWYIDNGTKFKACNVGDLSISQHGDSVDLLSDLWIRQKDQAIFDQLQGSTLQSCPPTHIYPLGCSFEWNDLMYIERAAKKSDGLVTLVNGVPDVTALAPKRKPLDGYQIHNGVKVFLCVIDSVMSLRLRADPRYQTIKINADVRGKDNAVLSGVIGKESNVVYIEADAFFGTTAGSGAFNVVEDTETEQAGLRRYAVGTASGGRVVWEGQCDFDTIEIAANAEKVAGVPNEDRLNMVYSRGLLLGAGAAQLAMGQTPDYGWEETKFGKSSQSMLELVFNVKKTNLRLEMGKDYAGRSTDLDYGVIAIDMEN